ncbi:hypothetical protein [Vibrio furnissii]|uniref:hypothetical protein n=1 Tax=Vibrio furnissii TaxID=29494 RepID=UPI001EEA8EA4|nr:hypothetical protein [Vibrio furnissii]MCG6214718.1 hypothetical protein [Vibrio furnissii]
MNTPNYFFYIAFSVIITFILYRLLYIKRAPLLTDVVQLFLATMAACSSLNLLYIVLEGTKELGDFQSYKESIILGAVAVIWVSIQTLTGLVSSSQSIRRSNSPASDPETT